VPSNSRKARKNGPSASSRPAISLTEPSAPSAPVRKNTRALPMANWSKPAQGCGAMPAEGGGSAPTCPTPSMASWTKARSASSSRSTSPPAEPGRPAGRPMSAASSAGPSKATS
jgi:hypothetical protein